jgi:hypothetical protein
MATTNLHTGLLGKAAATKLMKTFNLSDTQIRDAYRAAVDNRTEFVPIIDSNLFIQAFGGDYKFCIS